MGAKHWQTPRPYFDGRDQRFRFNVDAFASDANALVRAPKGRYYTAETNGLNPAHYRAGDRVFANPPYDGTIAAVVRMFVDLAPRGVLADLLLPPSVDTSWFQDRLWASGGWRPGVSGDFYKGRLHFFDPENPRDAPRAGNLIVTVWPDPARFAAAGWRVVGGVVKPC